MIELEPCPFCGNKDLTYIEDDCCDKYVRCRKCHTTMAGFNKDELIRRWNGRVA